MTKKLFKVFTAIICSLLLSSCGKDALEDPNDLIKQQQKDFYGYNVKDKSNIDVTSLVATELRDSTFLTGFKDNKMWITLFDKQTKEQLQEWNATKTIERTIKIDKGYGEYDIFNIGKFILNLEKTDWGFVSTIEYIRETDGYLLSSNDVINKDMLFLKDKQLIHIQAPSIKINNPNWYKGSIVISQVDTIIVLSANGEKICELNSIPHRDNNIYPVSYTDGLNLTESNYISRFNFSNNKYVWKTSLDIESNARKTVTILDKDDKQWTFQFDVVNYDGSKQQVKFSVDIATGEIIYL